MPEVILLTDNQPHYGWQEVTIDRGVEFGAWAFTLLMTERWDGRNVRPIRAGQSCQLKLDNELLITGYIDAAEPAHDKDSHGIAVRGRSKTADLIDCSTTGQEFIGRSLVQIAQRLCAPFNITVIDQAQASKPFAKVRIAAGQPIYEFLEYLSRIRAVRLVPTAEGDLMITRAGTSVAPAALRLGENIEAAKASVDYTQMFSDYTVTSQQDGDLFSTAASASVSGHSHDERVTRHRPTVVPSDSPMGLAACRTRAEHMRNTHYGRGRSAMITVSGWQQSLGGQTWQPNARVMVNDSKIGIDGQRLIAHTQMKLDKNGTRTQLKVMPVAAFELTPLPDPKVESGLFG